jgi:6-phosphogluconolactonase
MTGNRIYRHTGAAQAAEACGKFILERLDTALASAPRATLAISGGNSPRPMFEFFAASGFDWQRVDVFWIDERHVPRTDPQSNFKMTRDTWLAPAAVPPMSIHAVDTSVPPEESARRYADEIRRCFFGPGNTFPGEVPKVEIPKFDVVHLGMGPDCHTASLFPGEPLIDDRTGLTAAVWVEKMKQWRVTLLPGVLIAARCAAMLITGSDKAEPLCAALYGTHDPQRCPAQLILRDRPSPAAPGVSISGAALFVDDAASRLVPG